MRVLSIARDQGSMQAIAPVVRALQGRDDIDVRPIAFDPDARPYAELGIHPHRADISDFTADPRGFTRRLLDQWQPDLVLMGSSVPKGAPPNTPEQYLTIECRGTQVATIAVLDAWGYYAERFGATDGVCCDQVPDAICALDHACADGLRQAGVPAENIAITHNPWLDRIVESAGSPFVDGGGALRVLFVSQPLVEHRQYRNWPYTQHELFRLLTEALRDVRGRRPADAIQPVQLTVVLHPAENGSLWGEHLAAAADLAPQLCLERGPAMYREIDVVVTSHSTLVYEALHLDVPCIHLRPGNPPWARSVADALGLVPTATNSEELIVALDTASKRTLRDLRLRLSKQGVFFSDGHATDRVVAAVLSSLQQRTLS